MPFSTSLPAPPLSRFALRCIRLAFFAAAGLAVEGAVLVGKGVAKAGELVAEAVQDKPAQGQAK